MMRHDSVRGMRTTGLALVFSMTMVAGCGGDNNGAPPNAGDPGGPAPVPADRIFDGDDNLQAEIRRTTNGAAHIRADNLESAGFGQGYAQAQDNICLIAEQVVKANSQRARFFGPGPQNINIIKDFSYKALEVYDKAEAEFDQLSDESRAIIQGFAAGYNDYLATQGGAAGITDPRCANQPWVRPITPVDLFAYYRIIALFASGDLFTTGVLFAAAPPNVDPSPRPVMTSGMSDQQIEAARDLVADMSVDNLPDIDLQKQLDELPLAMGSNGWGIGSELSETSGGALLANPHFPYNGPRRFWQSHMTVPDVIDVVGAGLIGYPLPQIGFNENLGWTHTVTTSNRFTAYVLALTAGDGTTYIKDDQARPINKRTFTIEVTTGGPQTMTLEKDFYYSEYGPMIAANLINPAFPAWGDVLNGVQAAITYRDANARADDIINQWLGMGRASNLEEFQSVFANNRGTLWVNTMYADDQGNAFYIDGSSVPNLSPQAIAAYRNDLANDPTIGAAYSQGFVVLPGTTSLFDWQPGSRDFLTPFEAMPKLSRSDFVQNSNDSYWATNPEAFLTGFSPLYGPVETQQGPRTRLGLHMLQNPTESGPSSVAPAGNDGLFNGTELMDMLYSNRALYSEPGVTGVLDALRTRCAAVGADPVTMAGGSRSVDQGCAVLENWDGLFNLDSVGAHVFRVFIASYDDQLPGDLTVPFDPADPVNTPRNPTDPPADLAEDPMLGALAAGLDALDNAGIPYAAPLGQVQFVLPSNNAAPLDFASLSPTRAPIPWPGGDGEVSGVFNDNSLSASPLAQDTLYPVIAPQETVANTGGLSATAGIEGWLRNNGTSWHFGLSFGDSGPEAVGLLSYSQSSDSTSPFFADQQARFSAGDYRPIRFTEAQIDNDPTLTTITVSDSD